MKNFNMISLLVDFLVVQLTLIIILHIAVSLTCIINYNVPLLTYLFILNFCNRFIKNNFNCLLILYENILVFEVTNEINFMFHLANNL